MAENDWSNKNNLNFMERIQRFSMLETEKVASRVLKKSSSIAQVTPINQIKAFPKLNTPRCNLNLYTTRKRSLYVLDTRRLPKKLPPVLREPSRKKNFCGSPIRHLGDFEDNNEKSIFEIIKAFNN